MGWSDFLYCQTSIVVTEGGSELWGGRLGFVTVADLLRLHFSIHSAAAIIAYKLKASSCFCQHFAAAAVVVVVQKWAEFQ